MSCRRQRSSCRLEAATGWSQGGTRAIADMRQCGASRGRRQIAGVGTGRAKSHSSRIVIDRRCAPHKPQSAGRRHQIPGSVPLRRLRLGFGCRGNGQTRVEQRQARLISRRWTALAELGHCGSSVFDALASGSLRTIRSAPHFVRQRLHACSPADGISR
jgi:hypothetical protein